MWAAGPFHPARLWRHANVPAADTRAGRFGYRPGRGRLQHIARLDEFHFALTSRGGTLRVAYLLRPRRK